MRKVFIVTGGISNDLISWIISSIRPSNLDDSKRYDGVLGNLSKSQVEVISKSIDKYGYFQFESKLSEDAIKDLVEFAETKPCLSIGGKLLEVFEPSADSPRYDFQLNQLIQNKIVCSIITDSSIKAVATEYLKTVPICDIVAMWWSVPSEKKISAAAQNYHFDMDRFKFLKFFFYLTDVDYDNGPHCFIEASHRSLPWSFRRDGRFNDSKIYEYYEVKLVKKFLGKKGTILAVDTRGLHKGERVINGKRLLFQIEFTNFLFGSPYETLNKSLINKCFVQKFQDEKETYLKIAE